MALGQEVTLGLLGRRNWSISSCFDRAASEAARALGSFILVPTTVVDSWTKISTSECQGLLCPKKKDLFDSQEKCHLLDICKL